MARRGIPPKESIPRRKGGKAEFSLNIGGIAGGLFRGLANLVEGLVGEIGDFTLDRLENLAEAQKKKRAKEDIQRLKGRLNVKEGQVKKLFTHVLT